jgi:deoxyribose-phosphate aldolase
MINLAKMDKRAVGKLFDYSILPKQSTEAEIRRGCREAVAYNCAAFYSASPYWTPVVKEELAGTDVLVATGIDFPWGVAPVPVKMLETEMALAAGCQSVDLVINAGALKSGHLAAVRQEIQEFVALAKGRALTKIILEVCFLTDQEIVTGCRLIQEAGADYAKTSTGQFEGPDMAQVLLMRETLKGSEIKLKVAGVKFPRPQNAYAFILAGAALIGTRAAPEIIDALDQMRAVGIVPPYAP